jgi:hypothetical protein
MSSKDRHHQSVSKTVKVTCRVETCKEQVLAQNYERHLKRYHPQEDSKILRTYGQKQISFGRNKSQPVVKQSDAKEDKVIKDINENITSAHKSKLEMEEADLDIADDSHSSGCVQTRQGESLPLLVQEDTYHE